MKPLELKAVVVPVQIKVSQLEARTRQTAIHAYTWYNDGLQHFAERIKIVANILLRGRRRHPTYEQFSETNTYVRDLDDSLEWKLHQTFEVTTFGTTLTMIVRPQNCMPEQGFETKPVLKT
jgi:hypothetical protein